MSIQLDEQYNAVFEKNSVTIPEGDSFSPMVRKLKERKTRKTVEQYVLQIKKEIDSNETSNPGNSNANIEILPYRHSLVEIIRGKHFDLSVDPQYVTVLYEIYLSWSQTTKTKYYFAKKIDSIEKNTYVVAVNYWAGWSSGLQQPRTNGNTQH